jgi:hypothetical protein
VIDAVADSRTVLDIDHDAPWPSGRWPIESWFIVSNLDSEGQRLGLQLRFQTRRPGVELVQLNVVAGAHWINKVRPEHIEKIYAKMRPPKRQEIR